MKNISMALIATVFMMACGTEKSPAGAATTTSEVASTAKPIEITSEQFKTEVADYTLEDWKYLGDKPAIVDFYATWCGPCKQIAPILKDLAKQYDGKIVIYKVDVDQEPELASAFGIESIPSLLFIPMGDRMPIMKLGSMSKADFIKIIETELLAE